MSNLSVKFGEIERISLSTVLLITGANIQGIISTVSQCYFCCSILILVFSSLAQVWVFKWLTSQVPNEPLEETIANRGCMSSSSEIVALDISIMVVAMALFEKQNQATGYIAHGAVSSKCVHVCMCACVYLSGCDCVCVGSLVVHGCV